MSEQLDIFRPATWVTLCILAISTHLVLTKSKSFFFTLSTTCFNLRYWVKTSTHKTINRPTLYSRKCARVKFKGSYKWHAIDFLFDCTSLTSPEYNYMQSIQARAFELFSILLLLGLSSIDVWVLQLCLSLKGAPSLHKQPPTQANIGLYFSQQLLEPVTLGLMVGWLKTW